MLTHTKMAEKIKELRSEIEIPEGFDIEIKGHEISVRKEGKEIRKNFPRALFEKEGNKLVLVIKNATKKERKNLNSVVAHVKNMLKGLNEKFVYKLQVCAVHFPMNVAVKGENFIIKNFLGETKERKAKILPNAEVDVNGVIITVKSSDKDAAGQTAANIEKAAKVRNRDRRVFQDGIFMTEEAGKVI